MNLFNLICQEFLRSNELGSVQRIDMVILF